MATGIKKGTDPKLLSHTMWAAWGVINIETLGREPRRNYLMTVRAELETRGCTLEVGGISTRPFYRVNKIVDGRTIWSVDNRNKGTFGGVLKEFLKREDPSHAEPDDAGSAAAG